jgi:hypothetical protein
MKAPNEKPTVKLIGQDGNAFFILGKISDALREAGADPKYIQKYFKESTAGDYNNLLQTARKFANIV